MVFSATSESMLKSPRWAAMRASASCASMAARIQLRSLTKALLGQAAIALGQRSLAQPVLNESIRRSIIDRRLESIDGVIRLAVVEQHNSVQHGNLRILAVLFHQLCDYGSGRS
jgi:DNA-directed RNA polymerase